MIPLHPQAADALRNLIQTAKDGNAAARHGPWAQRPVRYVFMRRGKPMGDLYLRCSKFFTTSEYAPRLQARLLTEQQLIQDATERGWPREAERHTAIIGRIRELLADLGEPAPTSQDGDPPTRGCG
ncbi:hypothetical protein ABT144_14775 [Streptomyces sp. NPDC002039]|uniref:hypothetical protein n=1 Tax=Streptomyces sp. NPDC002039 TaxID=3154660 RepID=UPI003317BB05